MKSADPKSKILFLNGREVASFEPSGDEAKDLAAAQRLLAEEGAAETSPSERYTEVTESCRASVCDSAL